MRVLAVFITVLLTFSTSVILKTVSSEYILFSYISLIAIFFVFSINALKFLIWGWLNKRYDLSKTYPLTALFFPIIFVYAIVIGDTAITLQKVIGLVVILFGLYVIEKESLHS